ncbi:hypothetical protein F4801DRAFT_582423 [Xylaria longipes]|nr:hypothetical protein F4801DRAFT_582423 [Xylaria longipes]
MEHQIIFLLSILLVTQLFLAGVLAAPGRNPVANSGNSIIMSNNFKGPAMVTVSVAAIETTIVDTIMVLSGSTTTTDTPSTAADDQHETVAVTYTAEPGADAGTFTGMAPLSVNSATPLLHAASTSSLLQIINTDSATMTAATITAAASSLHSTSKFDDTICDDIFCNTDGNKICIYWGGVTSWDISLGPMPGERPTVIGTC